jgi:hypothetical protein
MSSGDKWLSSGFLRVVVVTVGTLLALIALIAFVVLSGGTTSLFYIILIPLNAGTPFFWACGIGLSLVIYFLPAIWAYRKNRKNKLSILLLNIFLGWTLIGWVVALVWTAAEDK